MATGTVKWFDDQRGFGYLLPAGGGPDVFVHRSALTPSTAPSLTEGQAVVYEVEATPRGPRALAVRSVTAPAS